jgi:hypothetical protein
VSLAVETHHATNHKETDMETVIIEGPLVYAPDIHYSRIGEPQAVLIVHDEGTSERWVVHVFGDQAENAVLTFRAGHRVLAVGNRRGDPQEIFADHIGASLKNCTADIRPIVHHPTWSESIEGPA